MLVQNGEATTEVFDDVVGKNRKVEEVNGVYYVYPYTSLNGNIMRPRTCTSVMIVNKYTKVKRTILTCSGKDLPYIMGQFIAQLYGNDYQVYVYLQHNTINLMRVVEDYRVDTSTIEVPVEHTYMGDEDSKTQVDALSMMNYLRDHNEYSLNYDPIENVYTLRA